MGTTLCPETSPAGVTLEEDSRSIPGKNAPSTVIRITNVEHLNTATRKNYVTSTMKMKPTVQNFEIMLYVERKEEEDVKRDTRSSMEKKIAVTLRSAQIHHTSVATHHMKLVYTALKILM